MKIEEKKPKIGIDLMTYTFFKAVALSTTPLHSFQII
jgi:hypothetical protein